MNRLEIIKSKYPEHYDLALKVDDPSGKQKYLPWIAKQLSSGYNSTDISQTLKFFHENTDKFKVKDIHKYKDLKSLEDLVKEFGISNRQAKSIDKQGSEKIFEDENLMVIRIDDKPAMVLYGANTQWCTTMKEQSYYEDYVAKGNDFYIVISKNPKTLSSSKYAIVRKGLLEFNVYDAKDNYARSFSELEEDILRDAIKAIISDKPPKNFLRLVIDGKIAGQEAADWLKLQTEVTRNYVEQKKPELKFVYKTADELVEVFHSEWNRKYLNVISEDMLLQIVNKIKNKKDKEYTKLKLAILNILSADNKHILSDDISPDVRAKVAEYTSSEKAKEFLNDNSLAVFKSAARKVEVQVLLDFFNSIKSSRKKKAANEVIVERISQEKVRTFILNQPSEVIKELMT